MSRSLKALFLLAVLLAIAPAAALAQGGSGGGRGGDMAVSGNLGFANAFDDDFDGIEPFLNGTFEYYTSNELSWRGMLGWVSFDAEDVDADAEYMLLSANVLYHFAGSDVTPFVTGGLGLYDVEIDGPGFDEDDLELALNGGGGVDIWLNAAWAVKIEGLFHVVGGDGPDSIFTATGGAKFRW